MVTKPEQANPFAPPSAGAQDGNPIRLKRRQSQARRDYWTAFFVVVGCLLFIFGCISVGSTEISSNPSFRFFGTVSLIVSPLIAFVGPILYRRLENEKADN